MTSDSDDAGSKEGMDPLVVSHAAGRGPVRRAWNAMVRGIPLGRLGQPDDVAAAVAFFASDEAGFITGQTLSVSGGMSMV